MFSRLRAAALRAYLRTPEHPTKYRVVTLLGRYAFPDDGVWATVPPGVRLRLHPRDWIEYTLLRGDPYEPATLAFLSANLRAGDRAVLAGVNFGLHAVVAARAVGPGGGVLGIDPQPAALLRTRAHLAANGLLDRATLLAGGLGEAPALVPMAWAAAENTGAASLFDPGAGLLVPILPFGAAAAAAGFDRPRLFLLDVEGYELRVLAGLGDAVRPDLLVVECAPDLLARGGATAAGLFARLTELGYQIHDLRGTRLAGVPDDLPEKNLVCVRPGADVSWPTGGRG